MIYVTVILNHLSALQQWAKEHNAYLHLDLVTFEIEVRHKGRYFFMFPAFIANRNGRLSYVPQPLPETIGFAGWRPYRPFSFALSTDKLAFKAALFAAGLPTPRTWHSARDAETDFILKRSRGSFGYQLAGPFRPGGDVDAGPAATGQGTLFAEQFIRGSSVKVWFWGSKPFFAHAQAYPTLTGDGRSTLGVLAQRRFSEARIDWETSELPAIVRGCLAYQGHSFDDILEENKQAWIDYRYGRTYIAAATNRTSDNQIQQFSPVGMSQLAAIGKLVAKELRPQYPAPLIYAVDGMLDSNGVIWWLEMNSNPVLPPEGYAEMFGDLFA
jgi:hypothetical protein